MKVKLKLKHCPFCGGKAKTFQIPKNTPEEMARHPAWVWKDPGMWVVGCTEDLLCYGNYNHKVMVFFTEEEAVEAWNRRADNAGAGGPC